MTEDVTLSVLVPVFNEEDTVAELLGQLAGCEWVDEIVVVDDGSTDGTAKAVEEWRRTAECRTQVLAHDENRGKGAAVRTALEVATASHVVVQDGDLEYDPRDLGKLVEVARDDPEACVYGSRFLDRAGSTFVATGHSAGNRYLTWFCNLMSGGRLRLSDMATCYKLAPRRLLLELGLTEDCFGFDPEVTLKIAGRGVAIREVPVSYAGRDGAAGKKIRWRDGLLYLRCIWRYRVRKGSLSQSRRGEHH